MDRDENFVLLSKGNHQEYVKQATKTSLDSYSTVLMMENKVVTKKFSNNMEFVYRQEKHFRAWMKQCPPMKPIAVIPL